MTYIIAQILGFVVTVLNIAGYQFKKKWHILANSALANFVCAANYFLLGGALSATAICIVGGAQSVLSAHHAYKCTLAKIPEKIIFLCAYLACGIWQYNSYIDLLPALGSLFFMVAAFQKDAQKLRIYLLFNAMLWLAYSLIIGSTAVFAYILALVSNVIGLYRFRKKKTSAEVNA